MRLAFLTFSTVPFGSNDLLYYRTALRALDMGHAVLVSPYELGSKNAAEYHRISQLGADVFYRSGHVRHPSFIARQWQKLVWRLHDPISDLSFLDRWKPDVVVLNDAATYHMLSAPGVVQFVLNSGIPFATISQFNDENAAVGQERFRQAQQVFARAVACVFVSQRNLDVARRQLCLSLPQAAVLDNPPNVAGMWEEPFPESTLARMAMVARLETAVKGQALVLDIMSREKWRSRDWILNIYGQGPDEEYLRELVVFYGLQHRVNFCGQSADIRQIWRENMILLMCSAGEGKPLALMEAMVCGRTAVVTDVGGNAELIEEGVSGFVAESATIDSFSSALERAWGGRESWMSMGRSGHVLARRRLTPEPEDKLLKLVVEAVRSLTAKEGRPAKAAAVL